MKGGRRGAMRRLLADLRRPETRGDAVRRVRRRSASTMRRLTGRSDGASGGPRSAAPGPAGGSPVVPKPDAWYVAEWGRLAAAVLGDAGRAGATGSPAPGPEVAPGALLEAGRQRAASQLADAIGTGEPLERAVCRAVTALADTGDWRDVLAAWALAEGAARLPGGGAASAMGHAIVLHRRRQLARAWTRIRDVDDETLRAEIPVEAVEAALADGSDAARGRAVAIGAPAAEMDGRVLIDLAGRFLAVGERERAADLVAELRGRAAVEVDDRRRHAWTLIEGWLEPRPRAIPAGSIPFGVLDYRTPDHVQASGNLGDYIQTLALLGNLARHTGVRFTGEDALGDVATGLQGRVRDDLRLPGARGSVHLLAVDRDFSGAEAVPPGTWMLAYGWHMHSLFDLRSDFPYHLNIRPVFISFHVNRLEMLTDEAKAYLRRYGPVGCRDWTTVFLLLAAGIDAFFSGCLTTTVDALFPPRQAAAGTAGAVGVIDLPRKAAGRDAGDVRVYGHESDGYHYSSMADGIRAADDRLATYLRGLRRAITGGLSAYLPLTALGIPVEFRPGSPGDIRFAGLTGLQPGDPRLAEMQGCLRDLIAGVVGRVLEGASEDDVYATWRDITRDRVAEATARFEADPVPDEPTTIDVAAAVATSLAGRRRFGPHEAVERDAVTDVVLAFDENLLNPAAVLVESILDNASGPVRLWVLGRGLPAAYPDWLAAAFPSLPMTYLPCDGITFGPAGRPRRIPLRITISTMDRLLLPAMLEDVDRLVYLDVDTLMLGDVCELARTDLGGRPVAARDSFVSEAREWRRAGRHLAEPVATELRRRMLRQHGDAGAALNAGVLVMDLDRMRRDDFTSRSLGWVEQYGMNDQDSMLAYVGPERCVLDPRWNVLPIIEDVEDPWLIHWASLSKPWEPRLTQGQARWQTYASGVHARVGSPPAA